MFNNNKLTHEIKDMIGRKVNKNITLGDIYNKYGNKLFIATTSISCVENNELYINYKNNPDIPLWKAILMSSTLPFIFPPVLYKKEYYIDGALCNTIWFDMLPANKYDNAIVITTNFDNIKFDFLKSSFYDYLIYILNVIYFRWTCINYKSFINVIYWNRMWTLNYILGKLTKEDIILNINSTFNETLKLIQ